MKTIGKILILSILIFGLLGCQQETSTPSSNNQNQNNQNQNNPNQTTGSEVFWNASDYDLATTYSENTQLGSVTLLATSGKTITTDSNPFEIDGYSFSKRIKFGGSGSTTYRALKFTTTGTSTITAYCVSGNSTETGRMLVLATADSVINDTNEAPLTAGKLVYSDVPAGTYYLYSNNSGINIYGIKIAYETTDTPSKPDTNPEKAIRVTDVPTGWASISANSSFGGNGKTVYTVSSRSDLITKAKKGNCIIYLTGMIDMTEGMLPSSGKTSTTKLDEFIKSKTSGQKITASSYAEWKTTYAANVKSSEDESGDIATVRKVLQNAWKTQIQLEIGSNTTIIGLGENSGIKGGTISIKDASNIALRNLIIQDAFDPFPKMEGGDGYNAEWDGIVIDNSKNIWIDHCTFEDTICLKDEDLDKVTPSDGNTEKNKWQTYDGLLDVKNASDYVTVSYCLFKNHDKTSIIGSSDSETGDEGHLTVTFNNNYYLNCTQRLPRVRFGKVHAYNNYYTTDGNGRPNSYCFGVGYNAKIYSEANYFGDGIGTASDMMSNSKPGKIYSTGDYNYSGVSSSSVGWTPSSYYTYTPLSAAEAKADVTENAGAGKLPVIQ